MRSPLPVAAQSPGQGIQGGGSGVGTTSVENVKVQLRRLRGSGGVGGTVLAALPRHTPGRS